MKVTVIMAAVVALMIGLTIYMTRPCRPSDAGITIGPMLVAGCK